MGKLKEKLLNNLTSEEYSLLIEQSKVNNQSLD